MKHLLRTTLLSAILKLLGIGLTFIFFLTAARHSSDAEYGKFASMFSLATILGFACLSGQHLTILRYWPPLEERGSKDLADQAIRWSVTRIKKISIFFLALSAIAAFTIHTLLKSTDETYAEVGALAALTLGFSFSEFAQSALRARGEVLISLSGREVFWRIANIGILLLIGNTTGTSLLYIAAGSLWMVTLIQISLIYRDMAPVDTLPTDTQSEMKRASLWLWVSSTVGPASTHSGTVVVSIILGPEAAGAYFAADRIAKLLSIALIAVNQVAAPLLSKEYHAKRIRKVRQIMTISALVAGGICILGCIGYLVLGRFALSLFSESYTNAFPALMILTLGQVANTLCGPNTMLMNMAGLEKQNTMIMASWSVLGLILLSSGAIIGGIFGAAVGASITMAAWNVHVVWTCKTKLDIVPWDIGALRN